MRSGYINFFTVPFILFGLFLISITGYRWYKNYITKNWIPIEAEIVEVNFHIYGKRRRIKKLSLTYQYSIEGQEFIGDKLNYSLQHESVGNENYSKLYQKLNHSKRIKIFYNPQNFSESTIIRGLLNGWYVIFFISLFYNSILLGFWFWAKKTEDTKLLKLSIICLVIWLVLLKTNVIKMDTENLIMVVEEYDKDDCKFKESFKDYIKMAIVNFKMEKNTVDFNRKSSINKIELIERRQEENEKINALVNVEYNHSCEVKIKTFQLLYEVKEECLYKLLNINLVQ